MRGMDRLEIVNVEYPGARIPFAVYSESELVSDIIRTRLWYSRNDLRVYDCFLSPGDFFIDVGANIGWYSAYGALRVGPSGRVVALEPDPLHARLLRETIRRSELGSLRVVERAAARGAGVARLYRSPVNFGDHAILPPSRAEGRESLEIRTISLDDVVRNEERTPRLVKIDVQGFETEVLAGMKSILGSIPRPVILVEFAPGLMLRRGGSPFEMFSFIEKSGYLPYHVPGDHVEDSHVRPLTVEDLLVCVREFRDTELGWDLLLIHRDAVEDLSLCHTLLKKSAR